MKAAAEIVIDGCPQNVQCLGETLRYKPVQNQFSEYYSFGSVKFQEGPAQARFGTQIRRPKDLRASQ